jgi:hypothetical protein
MPPINETAERLALAIDEATAAQPELTPDQWDRIFAFIERLIPFILPLIAGK